MCFDSSSTTNSTSTFTPPPQVSAAGNQALSQAQSLGNAPFQIPTQPIANFTPQQLQAFQNINNTQGMAQPYFNAGATFQTPFGASQYFLPEAQGVTNELNNLYAQQMASVTGNLTQAAGGVGADRIAVGQSELANQQGLAEGQTLAQLYNNAVGQAQQAGVNLGNLGQGASNTALSEAAAQLGAGTQQQQLSQQDLNAVYKNILQQITWPYQTTQYLGALEAGVAPSLGGTTTGTSTTTSSPSVFSDIGSVFSILKRGGKVEGYDEGGSVPSDLGDLQAISSQLSAYISQRQQNQPSAPTAPNLGAPSQPTQVPSQGQGSTFGASPATSGFAALTGQQGGVSIPTLGGSIFGGNGNTGSTSQFTNAPFKGFFGFGRGGAPRHYDSGGPTQSNPNPYAAPAALAAYASPGAGSSGAALPTEDISQTMPQGLMGQLQQLNAERAALVNPLAPAAAPSSNGKGSFFGLGSLFAPASGFNLAQFGQPPTNANLTGNNVISPPHDTIGGFDGFGGLNFDQGGTVPSMDVPGVSDNEALMNLLGLQNLGAGGILSQTGQIHSPWASGAQRVAPAPNSGKPPGQNQGQNSGRNIGSGMQDLKQGFNQGLSGGDADVSTAEAQQAGLDAGLAPSEVGLADAGMADAGLAAAFAARGGVMNPFRTAHHFDDGGDVGGDLSDQAGVNDIPDAPTNAASAPTPDAPSDDPVNRFARYIGVPQIFASSPDKPALQAVPFTDLKDPGGDTPGVTGDLIPPTDSKVVPPANLSPFAAAPPPDQFAGTTLGDAPVSTVTPKNPLAGPSPATPTPSDTKGVPDWASNVTGDHPLRYGKQALPMDVAKRVIGTIESDNNYGTVGPQTRIGRALGRYQVMEAELPGQLKRAGLPSMTPQEFLKNKDAQDKLFEVNFGDLMKKYGNFNDAASAWFSGKPLDKAGSVKDAFGTTPMAYVTKANRLLAKEAGGDQLPVKTPSKYGNDEITEDKTGRLTFKTPFGSINPTGPTGVDQGKSIGTNLGNVVKGGIFSPINDFLGATGIGSGTSNLSRLGRAMLNPFAEPKYQLTRAQAETAQIGTEMARMGSDYAKSYYGVGNSPSSVADRLIDKDVPAARKAVADEHTPSDTSTAQPLPRGQAQSTSAPTAGATPGSTAGSAPAATPTLADKFKQENPGFEPMYNPEEMRQRGLRLMAAPKLGQYGPNFQGMGQQLIQEYNNANSTGVMPYINADGKQIMGPVPGWAEVKAGAKRAEAQAQTEETLRKVVTPQGVETYEKGPVTGTSGATPVQGRTTPVTPPPAGATATPVKPEHDYENAQAYSLPPGKYAALPGYVTEGQKEVQKHANDVAQQTNSRQVAIDRLNDLRGIVSELETGYFAEAKADAIKIANGLNIPIPKGFGKTTDPAEVEKLIKDATATVFAQVKDMGGRVLVSEITGMSKTVASEHLEPSANRSIIGRAIGTLQWQNEHDRDLNGWLTSHPGADKLNDFETKWNAHPDKQLGKFTEKAINETPAKGETIPPPDQRVTGRTYISPATGKKAIWTGSGWQGVQ